MHILQIHCLNVVLLIMSLATESLAQKVYHVPANEATFKCRKREKGDTVDWQTGQGYQLVSEPGLYVVHDTDTRKICDIFSITKGLNGDEFLRTVYLVRDPEVAPQICYTEISDSICNNTFINPSIRLPGFNPENDEGTGVFINYYKKGEGFKEKYHSSSVSFGYRGWRLPYEPHYQYLNIDPIQLFAAADMMLRLKLGKRERVFRIDRIVMRKINIPGVDLPIFDLYSYRVNGHDFVGYNYIVLSKNRRALRRYEQYAHHYPTAICNAPQR